MGLSTLITPQSEHVAQVQSDSLCYIDTITTSLSDREGTVSLKNSNVPRCGRTGGVSKERSFFGGRPLGTFDDLATYYLAVRQTFLRGEFLRNRNCKVVELSQLDQRSSSSRSAGGDLTLFSCKVISNSTKKNEVLIESGIEVAELVPRERIAVSCLPEAVMSRCDAPGVDLSSLSSSTPSAAPEV